MTTIAEVMTRDVVPVSSTDTVQAAAQRMERLNVGALPVCDGKRLIGMVTDRDIVTRAVAHGIDGSAPVGNIATEPIDWCFENDDLEVVQYKMEASQIHQMPVVDRNRHLIGMVALAELTAHGGGLASTLGAISAPPLPTR
jgi:CBS domain-containing protein